MYHEEVIEDMSPENMESGHDLGQFDSRFVPICASMIVSNDFPFDFLEHWALRNLAKSLNPDIVMPPINSKLYMLFDKYSSKSTSSSVQRTIHIQDQSSSMSLPKSLSHGLFDELKIHHQQLVTETGNWLYNFDSNDGEDDDDFEEIMNEIDGDDKMEQASNDSDFEDDDNDGEDGDDDDFEEMINEVDGDEKNGESV
ncbi:hypothetical protein QL285_072043 [Trifolium repens]|nr:hypothetical protein QL285_072043 [Trifolium repens]